MSGSNNPEVQELARYVFTEILHDIILTTAISAHREIKRGRTICGTCGTRCRSHQPLALPIASSSSLAPPGSQGDRVTASPSRASSPQPSLAGTSNSDSRSGGYITGPEAGTGGSTGRGSGSGRIEANGNVFFDCLSCGRSIASTRYAPHLSSCLGLNGSTRRAAARSAASKVRMGANDRSSPSPYVHSENGDSDGDSTSGKKSKKGSNGSIKRGMSPSKPPSSVLGKKSKFSSRATTPTPTAPRPSLPPSKLGLQSTTGAKDDARSPASPPSPGYSMVSSQGTTGQSSQKKLPGSSSFAMAMDVDDPDAGGGEYVPDDGDLSSEGPDDY